MSNSINWVVVLLAAASLVGRAQNPSIQQKVEQQLGKNVTVKEVTTRYDFSGIAREITLPFDRFRYQQGEQPAGYVESKSMKPATPAAQKLWNNWAKVLPSFGAPSQKLMQSYSGKEGGVIMYFRWAKPLPVDARKVVCKVLYGQDEKPFGADTKDDLLLSDDWCMIWSFAKPMSELKQAHQKRTFDIVNQEASRWMDANPEKAKKYLQPKK
ncbi:MAG: hypothetical protein FGM32_07720 [Candidatus Kapabacteria bacterium]|nr:hypothetical protein [Candidatus Kapabacteria bacterium]